MYKSISVLLISSVLLAGCGQSRLNPLNWFGRSQEVVGDTQARDNSPKNPLIPKKSALARKDPIYRGQLVAVIRQIKIEPVPGGAILRATGLADRQGQWDVKLQPLNDGVAEAGKLSFDMLAVPSSDTVGTERSRLLTVATYLTDQDLAGVRQIEVLGAQNAHVSRR